MDMKHTCLTHLFALLAMILCTGIGSHAQSSTRVRTITVEVEGLTTGTRDAITRDLQHREDLRLAYACVPAGILVFESPATVRQDIRDMVTPLLEHRVARQRTRFTDVERNTAEDRCAQARNR
jgi:hypothetical protein